MKKKKVSRAVSFLYILKGTFQCVDINHISSDIINALCFSVMQSTLRANLLFLFHTKRYNVRHNELKRCYWRQAEWDLNDVVKQSGQQCGKSRKCRFTKPFSSLWH